MPTSFQTLNTRLNRVVDDHALATVACGFPINSPVFFVLDAPALRPVDAVAQQPVLGAVVFVAHFKLLDIAN